MAASTIAPTMQAAVPAEQPEVERVDLPGEQAVQPVQAQHEHGDRHGGRRDDGHQADVALALDGEGGDVEPGTRCGE